jgi:hypothetical protein
MASSRQKFESQLDAAVRDGMNEALKIKSQGLLITRHNHTTVSVELSQEVPFGITIERDQFFRSGEGVVSTHTRGSEHS